MIKAVTYSHDTQPGPKLLVFGAVHGWEICGTKAIQYWIEQFDSGAVSLKKGSVTFVPICNPRAQEQNVRKTEADLNRSYVKKDLSDDLLYEEKLAQHLMPLIDACDYFLDLHSFFYPSEAFTFQDANGPEFEAFADAVGIENIIVGWGEYFPPTNTNFCSGMTYAIKQGKIGAVVECGSHDDPNSVVNAKRAINNILGYLHLVETKRDIQQDPIRWRLFSHQDEVENFDFAKNWQGFDRLKEGDLITTIDGQPRHAPQDCSILLPHHKDGCYYLVEESKP